MNPWHPAVAARALEKCEYCKAPQRCFNSLFEVEHVVPTCRGGDDHMDNLALACRRCNAHKSGRQPVTVDSPDAGDGIYNPRILNWDEHFEINLVSGEITGRTPVGGTTVALLQMNHPHAINARLLWIEFGIFP